MNYALIRVEPHQLPQAWPMVGDMIKAAMEKLNVGDAEVVRRELFAGEALLWLAWNEEAKAAAAAVTQIGKANGNKICTIVGCGGHGLKEWLPFITELERYASWEGCRTMRIIGRPGWKRALPDYHVTGYVLERTLH